MRLPPFSALRDPSLADDSALDPRFRVIEEYVGSLYGEARRLQAALAQLQGVPQFPPGAPPQREPDEFPYPDAPGSELESGDTTGQVPIWNNDEQTWEAGSLDTVYVLRTGDTGLTGDFVTTGQFRADAGLGVGNAAAATAMGTVIGAVELFDTAGASIGFLAIYDTFTP